MTALSKTGARRLAEAEEKIERGLSTFMEVGTALQQIRDERLYREQHDTFEVYCRQRWGFSSRRANQLMDAVEIGTIVPVANEGQARALAQVKDDPTEVREVFAEAQERGDTTAAGIARVVSERHPKVAEEPVAQEPAAPAAVSASAGRDADASALSGDRGEGGVPTPTLPPVDPALKMHAALSAARADVAKWIAFDRHDEVIAAMTTEQRADYRSFLVSVQTHVSDALHLIDDVPRLKVAK